MSVHRDGRSLRVARLRVVAAGLAAIAAIAGVVATSAVNHGATVVNGGPAECIVVRVGS